MTRLKQILIAFVFAIVVSSIQFWMAIRFSKEILWQVSLMHNIVGHVIGRGPILGYKNGQPMYEGTPIDMVAAFVGLGLGVIVYWVVGYFIMKKWHNKGNTADRLRSG
jgi:hypothetical protein